MLLPILDVETAARALDHFDKFSEPDSVAMFGELIGLVAVVLAFLTPVFIVLAVSWSRARRQRMQNDVVLKLAEKGQPIPPELFLQGQRRKSDLSSGLSLMGIGIGVAVGLWFAGGGEGAGFALIPFFIGASRLIAWKLEQKDKKEP